MEGPIDGIDLFREKYKGTLIGIGFSSNSFDEPELFGLIISHEGDAQKDSRAKSPSTVEIVIDGSGPTCVLPKEHGLVVV